jgi:hypothetical protein
MPTSDLWRPNNVNITKHPHEKSGLYRVKVLKNTELFNKRNIGRKYKNEINFFI